MCAGDLLGSVLGIKGRGVRKPGGERERTKQEYVSKYSATEGERWLSPPGKFWGQWGSDL